MILVSYSLPTTENDYLNDDMVGGTCVIRMVSEIQLEFVWKITKGQRRTQGLVTFKRI